MMAAVRRAAVVLAILLGFGIGACTKAVADTVLAGRVVRVVDGDTLWIRPDGDGARAFKLRMLDIDAPERCQASGLESGRALAARLQGQRVVVQIRARDDYRRRLGQVSLDGEDVNAWMVSQGWAWSTGWHRDPGRYAAQEREARVRGLGLHAQSGAIAPREFRRRHGPCR